MLRGGSPSKRATQESEMAEVVERDVAVGSDGALVERRLVHKRKFSPLAALIVLAFIATCAVVFFGDRLGLRTPPPATIQVTTPAPASTQTTAPAPQPSTP
jgi:hypothetical protein